MLAHILSLHIPSTRVVGSRGQNIYLNVIMWHIK